MVVAWECRPGGCVLLPLVLAALAAGCTLPSPAAGQRDALRQVEHSPWDDPETVLVTVNERPLTRGDFYRRVLKHLGTMEILGGVVKEELFLQEAERLGITVTTDEADRRAGEVLEEEARNAGGREKLAEIYARQGLSMADVRRDLVRKVKTELLFGKVAVALRRVDDAALREYYKKSYKHKRFVTSHILYSYLPSPEQPDADIDRLKAAARERAERTAQRLSEGADFETIARMESDNPASSRVGGKLGTITEEDPMPAVFKEVIFSLEPGEASRPVEDPRGGYHIFKVAAILPSESYVDCVEKMKREILERDPDPREIQAALEQLQKKANVRWHGDRLRRREEGGE